MFIHGLMAHFFLVLDHIPLSGWTSLLIHSPTGEHLSCFQFWAVVSKPGIDTDVQDLV